MASEENDNGDPLIFAIKSNKKLLLNIPPRYMWGWSETAELHGYCGETSFQSALLYYGNYVSAEHCRYADGNVELLIGENDVKAAKNLHLRYDAWNYNSKKPQGDSFVSWCKKSLNNGCPVITGFYQMYEEDEGDDDYDHIMIVVGYTVDKDGDDQLYFNDFYKNEVSLTEYAHRKRNQWICDEEPTQPFEYTLPTNVCYGISIKGIVDKNDECYRCRLEIPNFFKEPDWGAEDKLNEKPIEIKGILHIVNLTVGKGYRILRFDSFDSCPEKNFNKSNPAHEIKFTADKENVAIDLPTMKSDKVYFYRVIDDDY